MTAKIQIVISDQKLDEMKKWFESSGRQKCTVHEPEVLFQQMLQHEVDHGLDHEVDWLMALSMEKLAFDGVITIHGPHEEGPKKEVRYLTTTFLKNNLTNAWFDQTRKWVDEHQAMGLPDLDDHIRLRDRLFLLLESNIDPKDNEPYNAMMDLLVQIFQHKKIPQG